MADTSSAVDTGSATDVLTTVITTTSTSLTTSPTTTVTITDTSTSIPTETTTPTPTIVTTSIPPSTTVVTPTENTSPSVINVTATTTLTPSQETTTPPPNTASVLVVTSTQVGDTSTTRTSTVSSGVSGTGSSSTPSALSASGSGSGSSGGLGSGAKIAIAVIIPIVVIAAAFLIGFFLWRKRKARKNNEELRKNEMAEYGFNPNSDPTLAAGATAYTDTVSEAPEDNGGYRGWGATSSGRKASTTLGSNGRGALAMSESSSQPGVTHGSPTAASDAYSTDPLVNSHPESGDGVGALVAGAGVNRSRSGAAGVRRGPSNASSTYSEGHVSEVSSDNQSVPGPYYQEEVPYNIYNDAAPIHGPYGDGSYGGSGNQPVIRDVQARRNTRIERAPNFPQTQPGIAHNF